MKIFILKGAIGSGKTTFLLNYCKTRKGIGGILSPVINGKRHFLNIENNETIMMESSEGETEILNIGRYKFSQKAFEQANKILIDCANKNSELIVIDEIGPLELKGHGFADTVKYILNKNKIQSDLLIVIRESLVNEILNYFGIRKENVFDFTKH